MGLCHIHVMGAAIVDNAVVVGVLATDTPATDDTGAPAPPDESASPSPDEELSQAVTCL